MSSSKVVLKILNICVSLLVLLVVIFGLCKLGLTAYDLGYRVFTEKPMAVTSKGKDVIVKVEKGMSPLELGNTLKEKGLVRDSYLFVLQMQLSPYAKTVKPGLYTLSTTQTAREILQVLSAVLEEEDKDGADSEDGGTAGSEG